MARPEPRLPLPTGLLEADRARRHLVRIGRTAAWRGDVAMGLISLLWGIVALCWMVLALIPVIGITNWLLIPFAAVGAVIAAIGILFTRSEKRGRAKAGLILNGIVIVVAAIRLSMGGGLI
jgi:hypothetical protein